MASDEFLKQLQTMKSGQPVSPVAPTQTLAATPTPTPAIKPSATTSNNNGKLFSGNLLSKAFDLIRIPEYAIASFSKGMENEVNKAKAANNDTTQIDFSQDIKGTKTKVPLATLIKGGISNVLPGVENRTQFGSEPGNVNAAKNLGIKNEVAQSAYNLATSMAAPTLPVGKLLSNGGKLISKVPGVTKAVEVAGKGAVAAAKSSPMVDQAVELVKPFYKNPELGKMVEESNNAIKLRLTDLFKRVSQAADGLSPAEQARIGQILEGGITTNTKYEAIAAPLREFSEMVGKEAVDMGLMTPEQFSKYQGKYMTHIWEQMFQKGENIFSKHDLIPTISGQFFKARKGAEGYMREFAPAVFKGLGTEIKDVETAKLYKQIAEKYGEEAAQKLSSKGLSADLVNTLLKNAPKEKAGIGWEVANTPGFRTPQNIASDLLQTIEEHQPARAVENEVGLGTKIRVGGEGTKDYEKYWMKSSENNGGKVKVGKLWKEGDQPLDWASSQPFKSDLSQHTMITDVGKVEEGLPGPKVSPTRLNVPAAERTIKEGYAYAPEAVTNSKTGKFLKDIALPKEVVDYINKTRKVTEHTALGNTFDALMNTWKAGKTIWNPAYHIRNLISNQILSDMSTGKGLARTAYDYVNAVRNYIGKGNQAFVNAAEANGLIKSKSFGEAMEGFLKQAGVIENDISKLPGVKQVAAIGEFAKSFQQASEETAKLNVFKSWVEKFAEDSGKTIEEALADQGIIKQAIGKAEEAIFSPYRISEAERNMIKRIIPFYSFTRQALPFTTKTYLQHPERLAKYPRMEHAVEQLSPEDASQKDQLPDYRQNQVRLPVKNEQGNNLYFDPTYIYPYGNFGDAGEVGKLPFGLSVNPAVEEIYSQKLNKDSYFGKDIATSNIPERANEQRLQHTIRTVAPTLYTTITGKLVPTFNGEVDYAGRQRSKGTAVLDALGLKTSFFDPAEQAKFDRLDKKSKIKSIQSERLKIIRDPRIPAKEKQELMNELMQVRREVLTEPD